MSNKSDITINKCDINIKVVKVGNSKMTKATFRQIDGDDISNIEHQNVLGWVKDSGIHVLFTTKGELKKRNIVIWGSYGGDIRTLSAKNITYGTKPADDYIKHIKQIFDQLFIAT